MAAIEDRHDQAAYNATAIEVAERLTEARARVHRRPRMRERTRDELFGDRDRAGLGVALEWERMGMRPVSEDLEADASALGVELEHLGVTLGTVLHGLDLRPPHTPEVIAFVRAALLERKVVFFRDQHLTEDEQVALGRCFGELDAFPFGPPGDNPFVVEIAHGPRSPGTENGWHTDVTWMERPSLGSIAQLVDGPAVGGDTLFADSHAAHLGLPGGLRERLRHVHGVHDYRYFLPTSGPAALDDDLVAEITSRVPFGVSHPLLRTHPETGKTALYLHGGFLRHDSLHDARTGEPVDDSVEIVRVLLEQHARPEYQCRFAWEVGSVAFWDNRAVQHYATSDYFPERRLLRRVTIAGDRPYHDESADDLG